LPKPIRLRDGALSRIERAAIQRKPDQPAPALGWRCPRLGGGLSLGVLGLPFAGAIQTFIHEENDLNEVPRGWDHQISDGGEPTARVSWSRQSLLASNFQAEATEYEIKWGRQASVGYQTEASLSLSGRWGRINTPWWSFTPDRAEYVSEPAPVIGTSTRSDVRELFLWAGLKLRLRAYNAFLQGQFRPSEVEADSSDIERWVGEAWIGVTWQFSRLWRVSYVLRHQTAELERGAGNRSLTWGGLLFSRDVQPFQARLPTQAAP